jgi:phosphatidylglycerol:prolipoprotein diacylglycerol transferase
MHRTLFELGPVSVNTYGLMLAVAFWVGIELAAREARRRGLDPVDIVDLGIVILISSVVGSRLFYVLEHLDHFRANPVEIFKVWEGGLTFYGGLIAAVGFGILFLKLRRVAIREAIDVVAPEIALGIGIARIGCFMNGCCFGKESGLPWACGFPPESQAGWVLAGARLHPTQLYSTIANVGIFFFLRRRLHAPHVPGTVFYTFLVAYGIWRFAIDFLRYYEPNVYVSIAGAQITYNQIVSLGLVVVGLLLLARSRGAGAGEIGS